MPDDRARAALLPSPLLLHPLQAVLTLEVLADLPREKRIGVGVVNQKVQAIEPFQVVLERAERAVRLLGPERVLLNPDCGFATFADNPVASTEIARGKLSMAVEVARALRGPGQA